MTKRPSLTPSPVSTPAYRAEGTDPYAKQEKAQAVPRKTTHERVTTYLPIELAERLRDAAWGTGTTVSGIVEESLRREIDRMETEQGSAFKKRPGRAGNWGRPPKR